MKKSIIAFVLFMSFQAGLIDAASNSVVFEFWNKTKETIKYSISNGVNEGPVSYLGSNKWVTKTASQLNINRPTKLMITDPNTGQTLVYRFKQGKNIIVRIKSENNKLIFGPQTGPFMGFTDNFERGYSKKNAVTASDITLESSTTPHRPALPGEPKKPFQEPKPSVNLDEKGSLLVEIGKVCKATACYVGKQIDQVIAGSLNEAARSINLDLDKMFAASGKIQRDVATLKADIGQLEKQIGKDGTSYNIAKKIITAIDDFERTVKTLKKVKPPYTKVELTTAITGVPGFIERLYGGRSQEVRTYFSDMLKHYGTIRDNVAILDMKEIGSRVQKLISEIVYIMDDVTDIRTSTGQLGSHFFSQILTTNFRALRKDLAQVSTRIGGIVRYKSMLIGGPLSNTQIATRIGTGAISQIFDFGAGASKELPKIKQNMERIKSLMDNSLKPEGKMIEQYGKELKQMAQLKPFVASIKSKVGKVRLRDILAEIKSKIVTIRLKVRDILNVALLMIEQVAIIIENAQSAGVSIDKLIGGNFVQPNILSELKSLALDAYRIRQHSGAVHTELKKVLPSLQ